MDSGLKLPGGLICNSFNCGVGVGSYIVYRGSWIVDRESYIVDRVLMNLGYEILKGRPKLPA